eukprot:UN09425
MCISETTACISQVSFFQNCICGIFFLNIQNFSNLKKIACVNFPSRKNVPPSWSSTTKSHHHV